jgi:hypothetical protein
MVAALGLTAYYKNPLIPIASALVVFALTYVFTGSMDKGPFNDLRNKRRPK